jgi:hypothetical protein
MSKNTIKMERTTMTNTLVQKIKNLFKNTFHYLTVFAVGYGTVISVSTNSDSATRTIIADSVVGSNGIKILGSNVVLAAGDLVIMSTHALAMTSVLDIGTNALGATTATTGNFSYNDVEETSAQAVLLTSHTATGASDVTITAAAISDQVTVVTWSANLVTVGGVVTYKADTDTASLMTVNHIGVTLGGAGTNIVMDATGNGTVLVKLNAANDQTVTADINGAATGHGTLNIANSGSSKTVAILGSVGNTGNLLLLNQDYNATISGTLNATTVDIDGALTVTGLVTAATTTVDNGGATFSSGLAGGTILTMGSADVLTSGGDITSASIIVTGANAGITLTGADVTITGDINAASATDGGIINANGDKTTFAGNIGAAADTNVLVVNVAANKRVVITETGNFLEHIDMADGAELELTKAVVGGDVFTMDASLMTNADINDVSIYMPVNFVGGESLTLFKTAANESAMLTKTDGALIDTALIDYSGSNATGTITVNATAKTAAVTGSELSVDVNTAKGFAQALLAATDDTNVDGDGEDAFYNALTANGGFSATEDTALAKQVGVQTDTLAGSQAATRAMTGTVQGIVSNRMASLRSGDAYVAGVSAGGVSANSGFIQAFGTAVEQKNRKTANATIFGYDSETTGMAIGFDGITDGGSVIGLSLSLSESEVDGLGAGKSKNNIDSYTASIYADKVTDTGYIEGSLTVGHNDNSTSRIVNSAGLNRTYTAKFDSEQASLKIGGGFPNEVSDSNFVTPFASLTGTMVKTDTHTEVSTLSGDNLRLKIDQDDVASVVGSVGIKAHSVTNYGTPMISLAINNEFGDDSIQSTNTYTGGGTAFTTRTDVETMSGTLGLGYTFGSDRASFNLGYEAEANKDDYLSHFGTVKLVAKF